MVLLGLLGDVHKGNFTWNLKAFDEFQNLPDSPVRFRAGFSFQSVEFWQISLNYKISRQIPINQNFTWNLKAFDEFQSFAKFTGWFVAGFSFQDAKFSQISLNYKFPVRFP